MISVVSSSLNPNWQGSFGTSSTGPNVKNSHSRKSIRDSIFFLILADSSSCSIDQKGHAGLGLEPTSATLKNFS